jgi:hypothetical protein
MVFNALFHNTQFYTRKLKQLILLFSILYKVYCRKKLHFMVLKAYYFGKNVNMGPKQSTFRLILINNLSLNKYVNIKFAELRLQSKTEQISSSHYSKTFCSNAVSIVKKKFFAIYYQITL